MPLLGLTALPPRLRRVLVPVLALALAPAGSGCSFLLVDGPPAQPADAPLACTESRGSPVVDTLFGAGFAATAVHEATRDDVDPYFEGGRRNSIIAATVGAVMLAASSYYGWTRTQRCRRAIAARRSAEPVPPVPAR